MASSRARVQFVGYDGPRDVGGVSTWLRRLVPRLREQRIDARVDLFCLGGEPGANTAWFQAHQVPTRIAPWPPDTEEGVAQCLRWLNEDFPDVYVPNCMVPAYFAAAEARCYGARTVGILHSDDPFYWAIADEFVFGDERWRLDALVTVSRYLYDTVRARGDTGVPVFEIPYGVAVAPRRASWSRDRFRLVYAGRLVEEQKQISELARALCRVVRQQSSLDAWIVGFGSAWADVERIIATEDMRDRVVLKGRVDQAHIGDVLAECQAFVLLSDYEGLPIALLEAMAAGVVPICLDTRSGVTQVVGHMKNGILVRDRDAAFSDAVAFLATHPEQWHRLSAAARHTVTSMYSDERHVARWMQALLPGSSPAAALVALPPRLSLPPPNPKFGTYDRRRDERHGRPLLDA